MNFKKFLLIAPIFLFSPDYSNKDLFVLKKMDSNVRKAFASETPVNVIVHFDGKADLSLAETISDRTSRTQFVYDQLKSTAQKSQAPLLSVMQMRGANVQSFYLMNAVVIRDATSEILRAVTELPNVESISLDVASKMNLPKSVNSKDDPTGLETSIKFIKADQAWALGFKGQGIVIAGQDTGYDWTHPAIKSKYRGLTNGAVDHTYNWHDSIHKSTGPCGADSGAPCDDHGHGTHTMGTMLGDDGGTNKIGVAPDAKWISCRNMDSGIGTVSTYLECFEFFLAPYPMGGNPQTDGRPDLAPHVIGNSWSCPPSEGCTGGEFYDAIKALHAAGILVVVAAGNEGPGCGTIQDPPAYTEEVVVVGAYDHIPQRIAGFSSRGPAQWNGSVGPDFVAPGVNIRSAMPNGKYGSMSGTSMATPHVAGAVALLWSAKPALVGKIKETIQALRASSIGKTSTQNCGQYPGSAIPNAVFGYGIMDIHAAVTAN